MSEDQKVTAYQPVLAAFQPMMGTMLVLLDKPPTHSHGGLVLPPSKSNDSPYGYGVVVKVGKGTLLTSGEYLDPEVHSGDRVMFRAGAGNLFVMDCFQYRILRINEVIGKWVGVETPEELVQEPMEM